ncbi:unnamed protein product [Mytilus coruscus]|uniref:Reverse transcriptase domain-containing protein n=1 Tax=Mytilus coruscus TaxID=42192 RepID=A0A6J8CF38_MYTCO|nr:unnamed protein product [Mytilus coruscus]
MKNAAQRKKISTAKPSRPSTPTNYTAVMSPDVMEDLTNRVTERVASRMERRMEEIFDKITSKGNNGNSDVQEAEVQHHVDTLNKNIQGTCNGDQNHDNNNVVVSPEVLAEQPTVDKQIVGGQSSFVSCSLKTGGNIPDKIKQQIWAGRYIDFHSLFDNDETKYRLQLVQGADTPELSITEDRNNRTLTLNQWLSAWNKFTAIICTKNPELGFFISHHMKIILEMSREGGSWQYYDIEFRKLLERGEAQWGCTHLELYLRAKLQVNVKSGNDNNQSGNTRWPIGKMNSNSNTPVKVDRLGYWLKGYNTKMYNYLVKGFKYGFDVGFRGSVHHNTVDNLLSAKSKPDIVRQKIQIEISVNRFVGPFDSKPFTEMQLSPLGLAEKKLPGTYRMIHHLSFPERLSINDNIPQDKCSVQYASIQGAIELIKTTGKASFCAKTDISSAFRIIKFNIKESQYKLFGFMWEGKYYYDKNLQMGCSSSCQNFENFSTALERIAKNKVLIPNIVHILDDFMIVDKTEDGRKKKLERFLAICKDMGIPISKEKNIPAIPGHEFCWLRNRH